LIGEIERERAADDRLDTRPRHLVGEFKRPEHVVGVGERERGLAVGLGHLGQPRNRQGALEQGIGRVHMQVDEAQHSTLAILAAGRMWGRGAGAVHRKRCLGRPDAAYPQTPVAS
jgi:hypothetical protein